MSDDYCECCGERTGECFGPWRDDANGATGMEATLDDVLIWAHEMLDDRPDMGAAAVAAHWAGTFPSYRTDIIEHLAAADLMNHLAHYELMVKDVDVDVWVADARLAVERVEAERAA